MSMLQLRCSIWRRCITRDRRVVRSSACLSSSSSQPEHRAALPLLAKLEPGQRKQAREPRCLREGLRGDELRLIAHQVDSYVATLLEWNANMNLVSASQATRELILERHVEDALALLPVIADAVGPDSESAALRLVDVGSGAGFPGMVLAIARPRWKITLVDSMAKRVRFLEHVAATVPLTNVTSQWGRAEEMGHDVLHREQYDVAVARAVAELRILAEFCLPLVRVGGCFVAAKGADGEAEISVARRGVALLGGGGITSRAVPTLGPDGRPFTAITTAKLSKTPAMYPRAAPKTRPL